MNHQQFSWIFPLNPNYTYPNGFLHLHVDLIWHLNSVRNARSQPYQGIYIFQGQSAWYILYIYCWCHYQLSQIIFQSQKLLIGRYRMFSSLYIFVDSLDTALLKCSNDCKDIWLYSQYTQSENHINPPLCTGSTREIHGSLVLSKQEYIYHYYVQLWFEPSEE